MNNKDKHTPLSAEELFKLLEDKNTASLSDHADLDDFEKEALEGFSAHVSVEEARRLTEEVNTGISEAIQEKGSGKKKIIWFSSAASIALLIMISALFFYQTKQHADHSIALNEDTKEEQKSFPPSDETVSAAIDPGTLPLADRPDENASSVIRSKTKVSSEAGKEHTRMAAEEKIIIAESKNLEQEIVMMETQAQDKDMSGKGYAGVPAASVPVITSAESAGAKFETDASDQVVSNNKQVAETAPKKSESSASAKLKKAARKTDNEKNDEAAKTQAYDDVQVSGNASLKTTSVAYYKRGEASIKEYIFNYLKEKKESKPAPSAVYKITVTVFTTGRAKVKAITMNGSDKGPGINAITEALNTMQGWTPAIADKTPINSDFSFELTF